MAKVISDLDDAISMINTLYEGDSTPSTTGEEDYEVWTALMNVAINIWENEEGILWKELFVKLEDAATGDKTTDGTNTYDCPTNFVFPASGFVWLGSGTNKTAYKVISIEQIQLYENNSDRWCYFVQGATPTLEFNPNLTIDSGLTISYNYYKTATALVSSSGSSTFEMSDPMFAVYYALSELKAEEGDTIASSIAAQKLEAMKTRNMTPTWFEDSSFSTSIAGGFGV